MSLHSNATAVRVEVGHDWHMRDSGSTISQAGYLPCWSVPVWDGSEESMGSTCVSETYCPQFGHEGSDFPVAW